MQHVGSRLKNYGFELAVADENNINIDKFGVYFFF